MIKLSEPLLCAGFKQATVEERCRIREKSLFGTKISLGRCTLTKITDLMLLWAITLIKTVKIQYIGGIRFYKR
jgi:hypothetical protein